MTPQFVINLSPKAKAVVAFVVGAVVFVGGLLSDGQFNFADGLALAGWVGGTFGVYQVPNKPVEEVSSYGQ